MLSYALVAVQFGCIAVILASGPWIARSPAWLALEIAGLIPGCWAIAAMYPRRFNIRPDVRPGNGLVTRGPYRIIRHPMYTTVLLVTLALVLDGLHPLRLAAWGILLVDLLVKIAYEERLLRLAFDDYDAYRGRTWRLLPWIF